MFKDDKMISILTAILLMVLIGTVIQRADGLSGLFGGGEPDGAEAPAEPDIASASGLPVRVPVTALIGEVYTVEADVLTRIDVLENDPGLLPEERATLTVIGNPSCGRVFKQDGALQYWAEPTCAPEQSIEYAVQASGSILTASVSISINSGVGVPDAGLPVDQGPALAGGEAGPDVPSDPAPELEPEVAIAADPEPEIPAESRAAAEPNEQGADLAALAEPVPGLLPSDLRPVQLRDVPFRLLSGAAPAVRLAGLNSMKPITDPGAPDPAPVVAPRIEQVDTADPNHLARAPRLRSRAPGPEDLSWQTQRPRVALETTAAAALPRQPALGEETAGLAEGGSDFLVVYFEVKEPPTAPPAEPSLRVVERGPAVNPVSTPAQAVRIAALEPGALAELPAVPGSALDALPVDPADPPYVPPQVDVVAEAGGEPDDGAQLAALDPDQQSGPVSEAPAQSPLPSAKRVVTLPDATVPCTTPPATTLDVRRAAQTVLSVVAPCQANTVASLTYSGLRFAVPIDGNGKGQIMTLGFEANAPALLTFADDSTVDFDLPFKGVDRISRVALVWELPIALELNALEFGAETGSDQHVSPDNPRSFDAVRRNGGGFMMSFRSAYGIGQNAEIYTYYHKRGTQSGVVRMLIDFASRNRDRLEGTCGSGAYAAPQFMVLRSEAGRIERPVIRKLAPLDCSQIDEEIGDKRLISSGVSDLIVSRN